MTSTRISSLDSLHLLQSFVSAVGNWSGSHDINILLNIMCQGQQLVQASYSLHSVKTDVLGGTSVSEKTDTLVSIDAPPVVPIHSRTRVPVCCAADPLARRRAPSRQTRQNACTARLASATGKKKIAHAQPSERDRKKDRAPRERIAKTSPTG